MDRRAGLATFALLAVLAFSGCVRGPADRSVPDAGPAPPTPLLPGDLKMDGARLLEANATSIVWQWTATLSRTRLGAPGGEESVVARFDLPFGIRARATVRAHLETEAPDVKLGLMQPDGTPTYCPASPAISTPALPGLSSDSRTRRCHATYEATLPNAARGGVIVSGNGIRTADIGFRALVRLEALPARELFALREGPPQPLAIRVDDGTLLRGHAYLPKGEAPFATVLILSPYWNNFAGPSVDQVAVAPDGRRTLAGEARPLMDAGFAVALVNVRGTGLSEGCLQRGGPRDLADAAFVVETLAQQPWSNGRVGMVGGSYAGWTQDMAVAARPPSLRAVVPISPVQDPWHLYTRWGAPTADAFGESTPKPFEMTAAATVQGTGSPNHLQCPEHAEAAAAHARLVSNGDRDAWWAARDLRGRLRDSNVPTLATVGLQDDGHIQQLEGRWDLLQGPKQFILGQWSHETPTLHRPDWTDLMIDFLTHHLHDPTPARPWPNQVQYQDATTKAWHATATWPPPGEPARLHLGAGTLAAQPPTLPASQAFQSSRHIPVPYQCAGVQALFASGPLAADVRLAGSFRVNLTLESTLPDGNLAVFLYATRDVGPCPGTDHLRSVARTEWEWTANASGEVRRALTDLRHRGHLEVGQDFPVATSQPVAMTSLPMATTVPAGHRLVLVVGSTDPYLVEDPRKPLLTVRTGPGLAGDLVLPVVAGLVQLS